MTALQLQAAPLHTAEPPASDLNEREQFHRYMNDLQLIVSMMAVEARASESADVRAALETLSERVRTLADARAASRTEGNQSLTRALARICAALQPLAEPRGIRIAYREAHRQIAPRLSQEEVAALALATNELVTNAIKHAFGDAGEADGEWRGSVDVEVGYTGGELVLSVEDDGAPLLGGTKFGEAEHGSAIIVRLLGAIGARLEPPQDGSKRFEIRLPLRGTR